MALRALGVLSPSSSELVWCRIAILKKYGYPPDLQDGAVISSSSRRAHARRTRFRAGLAPRRGARRVGDLQQEAIAAGLGGAEQEVRVDLGQEPLRALALHLPHLDQRRRVEAA